MKNLEITLTKSIDYDLKPFGKFLFKWSPSKKMNSREDIIHIAEISYTHQETRMPYNEAQGGKIVKYMKKHKTDILVDDYGRYFTISGNDFVTITHEKLERYSQFLKQQMLTDCEESWKIYKN